MPHVLRCTIVPTLAALVGSLHADPAHDTNEYRQADSSFYLKSAVLRADPDAVIVTPSQVTDIGGSYLLPSHRHPARVVYLEQTRRWIEPITPPNMPASLDIPSDAMQVREPQGDVQAALPSAPARFRSVDGGMTLPNGSVLRTGDNGSVAVLFGGVDSVRLASDSQAAVQLAVTSGKRDAEVDIQSGMVFSKVGRRVGESETYAVRTPFGTATAHGTDFVTVVLPQRVDVWVAQGTVGLDSPSGDRQSVSVEGTAPFRIMRFPEGPDRATSLAESAESLTAILNFIPLVNQKLKVLNERLHDGDKLTDREREYIGRIREIPALIKLARIGAEGAPEIPPPVLAAPEPVAGRPMTSLNPPPFSPPQDITPPRAQPVILEATAAKLNQASDLARKKSTATKPAVAKAPPVKVTPAKAPAPKPAVSPKVAAAKSKSAGDEQVYLRAKPVTSDELNAMAPRPEPPAPAPDKVMTPESDPNSLAARHSPVAAPMAIPANDSTAGAAGNVSTPLSPAKPATTQDGGQTAP